MKCELPVFDRRDTEEIDWIIEGKLEGDYARPVRRALLEEPLDFSVQPPATHSAVYDVVSRAQEFGEAVSINFTVVYTHAESE